MMNQDQQAEHRAIEAKATAQESNAQYRMDQGNPRNAQVHATLAVSARLEALSYALRHGTVTVDRLL